MLSCILCLAFVNVKKLANRVNSKNTEFLHMIDLMVALLCPAQTLDLLTVLLALVFSKPFLAQAQRGGSDLKHLIVFQE